MTKFLFLTKFFLISLLLCSSSNSSNAQMAIVEAVKAATKKVIKAVDLKVQRLQNGVIDEQNVQKQIENFLSKTKLGEIADWTLKQKEQYQQYFDELWKVKTALTYYHRFAQIIALQKQIVNEYIVGYTIARQDKFFTTNEVQFIYRIYSNMINESVSGLDDLLAIMKSFSVQMTDAERLAMIDDTANRLESLLSDLRVFTRANQTLSNQRQSTKIEIERLKEVYGL